MRRPLGRRVPGVGVLERRVCVWVPVWWSGSRMPRRAVGPRGPWNRRARGSWCCRRMVRDFCWRRRRPPWVGFLRRWMMPWRAFRWLGRPSMRLVPQVDPNEDQRAVPGRFAYIVDTGRLWIRGMGPAGEESGLDVCTAADAERVLMVRRSAAFVAVQEEPGDVVGQGGGAAQDP